MTHPFLSEKCPAVIVDIDGTVALMGKGEPGRRGPFDWKRVGEDDPNWPVINLVAALRYIGYVIIFVSGRDEVCRPETYDWLAENNVTWPGESVFMRPEGDGRPDTEVKLEIYRDRIEPHYEVRYVLDDRNKVVRAWRSLGLTCLQVADGDF